MKHKLLSLFALAGAMFVSTSAMAWDEPVKPTRPAAPAYTGEFATPSDGGTYYILNVGAGQFLGAGNDWGTRAVTTTLGMVTLDGERANLSANNSHILPFTVESATPDNPLWEADFFFIRCQNTNKDETSNFLVHEDNAAWVDGWTNADNNRVEASNNGYWEIRANNGAYYLVPLDPEITPEEGETYAPLLGVHSTNMTATTSNTWCDAPANADYYVDWKFIDASNAAEIQAYIEGPYAAYLENDLPAYEAALEGYNKKSELLTALQEAEEAGVNTDAAAAVYNNPNATVADIENAIAALYASMKGGDYDFSGATEEEPLDVTDQVIVNPTFDTDISGWTNANGGNFWFQGRTDGTVDPSKDWVQISNFAETWTASGNTLADGNFFQTAYGMPAGTYRLEVDAMAVQEGDRETPVTGAFIYVASGDKTLGEIEFSAPWYQPKHWSITFVSNGEPAISYGIRIASTTANWISCDNFQLFYLGATDKTLEQLALDQSIQKAEEVDLDDVQAQKTIEEAFAKALADAKAAASSTDAEVLTAAKTALDEAYNNLQTSIAEYKSVTDFIKDLDEKMDAVDANHWDTLSEALYDWQKEIEDGYTDGTLTSEDIAGFSAKLQQMIRDFIATGAVKKGDDITMLLINADFSDGSGRDLTGNAVPGWNITSGGITELSASYHNIEAYHRTFDFNQTIPDMPAGVYAITVQGFVRVDGWQEDASLLTGDESNMVLYAGMSKNRFKGLHEEWSEYPFLGTEESKDENGNYTDSDGAWPNDSKFELEDGTPVYCPNSMQGADLYFQHENPATESAFYLNEVRILHKGGDLTVGVKCDAGNLWILWDNFKIKYLGEDESVYRDEVDRMAAEFTALCENENTYLTASAQNLYETLPAKADNIATGGSSEECIAMIEELDDAMAYIRNGNKLFDELQAVANDVFYARIMENPHTDANGYEDLVTEAADCKENPGEYADNDAVAATLKRLQSGWIAYVMADADGATEEEPYDATDILFNPDFSSGNADYWTIDAGIGQNQGYQGASYTNTKQDEEGEIIEEITISQFVEAWRPSTHLENGAISQKLIGALPEGYYRLQMDGYAVNQDAAGGLPEDGVQGVYLFTTLNDLTLTTPIGIEATSGLPEHFTVDFYSSGVEDVTVGVLVQDANCNWVAADNFQLFYLGKEAPDAVESLTAKTNTAAAIAIYGIDGRQQSQLRRGINIVRTADGTRKVMVK